MEGKTVFPVLGELQADDSPAVIHCEKPASKAYENTAKLFVVSNVSADQAEQIGKLTEGIEREEQSEPNPLKVTGDVSRDSIIALHSLAYLSEFFDALEPGGLRDFAGLLGVQP